MEALNLAGPPHPDGGVAQRGAPGGPGRQHSGPDDDGRASGAERRHQRHRPRCGHRPRRRA
eukprot:210503-Heterocapsa_arctica.AAC.1